MFIDRSMSALNINDTAMEGHIPLVYELIVLLIPETKSGMSYFLS
jgi:hypothetical protein